MYKEDDMSKKECFVDYFEDEYENVFLSIEEEMEEIAAQYNDYNDRNPSLSFAMESLLDFDISKEEQKDIEINHTVLKANDIELKTETEEDLHNSVFLDDNLDDGFDTLGDEACCFYDYN